MENHSPILSKRDNSAKIEDTWKLILLAAEEDAISNREDQVNVVLNVRVRWQAGQTPGYSGTLDLASPMLPFALGVRELAINGDNVMFLSQPAIKALLIPLARDRVQDSGSPQSQVPLATMLWRAVELLRIGHAVDRHLRGRKDLVSLRLSVVAAIDEEFGPDEDLAAIEEDFGPDEGPASVELRSIEQVLPLCHFELAV